MSKKFSTTLRGLDELSKVAAGRKAHIKQDGGADRSENRSHKNDPEPDPDYFAIAEGSAKDVPVMVQLDKLNKDLRYQYDPETEKGRIPQLEKWMKERGGYDPAEHGPFHVNKRPDGTLWNMDGGGGDWMARKAGLTQHLAIVHHLKTWEEEAAFFKRKNNNVRRVKPPHLFLTDAARGLEPERTIMKMVDAATYCIERTAENEGRVLAVTSLLFVWYLDGTGAILELALMDLRNTFGDEKSVDGRLLVALGVLRAIGAGKDQKRLRAVIQQDPRDAGKKGIKQLLDESRQQASVLCTGRSPQSRDTNPYLVDLIATRFNYRKAKDAGKDSPRLDPVSKIGRLRANFETPELIERYGKNVLFKDVWIWK
jgi:hypothetical protein